VAGGQGRAPGDRAADPGWRRESVAGEISTWNWRGNVGWRPERADHELSKPVAGMGHSRGWQVRILRATRQKTPYYNRPTQDGLRGHFVLRAIGKRFGKDRTAGCEKVVGIRFALDSSLEGDGFELPVPRVLEPSQFIRLLDTAFAFCRRDRRPPGNGCQNRGLYDIKVYGVKEDAALPEDSGTVFVR
jgi:hypothetical protein